MGFKPIGLIIHRYCRASQLESLGWLRRCWKDVAGPLAPWTEVHSLRKGTLTVKLYHPDKGEVLRSQRREIIKACNAILGAEGVLRLRWIPGKPPQDVPIKFSPERKAQAQKMVEEVKDLELREALYAFTLRFLPP